VAREHVHPEVPS